MYLGCPTAAFFLYYVRRLVVGWHFIKLPTGFVPPRQPQLLYDKTFVLLLAFEPVL